MTHFEEIKNQLTQAALSESISERTAALNATSGANFYDEFNDDEKLVLKTIRGDIRNGRAELALVKALELQPA